MKFQGIINFADRNQKQKFLSIAGSLSIPHELTIKPYSARRSNHANRYYFGCVVTAFVQFMEEQGEVWSQEQAHDLIARRCLGEREAVMPGTGEVVGSVRKDTRSLSKEEFAAYVDRATAWLAEYGIVLPSRLEYENVR